MLIGTTAGKVISAPPGDPVSFLLHADAGNTDTILVSGVDSTVQDDFSEELLAGQSLSFEEFIGDVYAVAESGTQKLSIPFVQYRSKARLGTQKSL